MQRYIQPFCPHLLWITFLNIQVYKLHPLGIIMKTTELLIPKVGNSTFIHPFLTNCEILMNFLNSPGSTLDIFVF